MEQEKTRGTLTDVEIIKNPESIRVFPFSYYKGNMETRDKVLCLNTFNKIHDHPLLLKNAMKFWKNPITYIWYRYIWPWYLVSTDIYPCHLFYGHELFPHNYLRVKAGLKIIDPDGILAEIPEIYGSETYIKECVEKQLDKADRLKSFEELAFGVWSKAQKELGREIGFFVAKE